MRNTPDSSGRLARYRPNTKKCISRFQVPFACRSNGAASIGGPKPTVLIGQPVWPGGRKRCPGSPPAGLLPINAYICRTTSPYPLLMARTTVLPAAVPGENTLAGPASLRIITQRLQHLPFNDPLGSVQPQYSDSRGPDLRHWLDNSAFQAEVIAPQVAARMKQPNSLPRSCID